MIKILLACIFLIGSTCDGLQQGDLCGIEGSNFLDDNFTGTITVAGEGCVSANNANCLCAPNFDDPASLSGFTFQCNGKVSFGPQNGKVCPEKVPVIKRVGVDSIDFTEDLVGAVIPCNTSIHPMGYPGDEVCGYSECESGGSFSAICGCVDLGTRGDTGMSIGMQWICMHSTCGCSFIDEEADQTYL
jgi:hypothetical protein